MSAPRAEGPGTADRSALGHCLSCDAALYVRLTRRADGRLERLSYCASCDRATDVTSNLARRAALVSARVA
jgi:hypothetical protein